MRTRESTRQNDPKHFLEKLRIKNLKSAEVALSENNFDLLMTIFLELSAISSLIGDSLLSLEFSRLSRILQVRLELSRKISTNKGSNGNTTEKPVKQLENAYAWKTYLVNLQHAAIEAFTHKNYIEARYLISMMVAIAKKIGYEEMTRNYKQNLKKVDGLLKDQFPTALLLS
jgi:hypothetical protein